MFLTLEEYLIGAKKIMIDMKRGFLTNDEDAVADVAHYMMKADETWDGRSSRNTWRYNQAKYAISHILKKKKRIRNLKIKSLDSIIDNRKEKTLSLIDTVEHRHCDSIEQYGDLMDTAKKELTPHQLHCLKMRYEYNMTLHDIGESLGITKQAVSLQIIAAIKRLKSRCCAN